LIGDASAMRRRVVSKPLVPGSARSTSATSARLLCASAIASMPLPTDATTSTRESVSSSARSASRNIGSSSTRSTLIGDIG
jgi:hypothetical protein